MAVRLVIEPLGKERSVIWLLDISSGRINQGPDGGEDHKGYTAAEVRSVLQERYGLSAEAAEAHLASMHRGND